MAGESTILALRSNVTRNEAVLASPFLFLKDLFIIFMLTRHFELSIRAFWWLSCGLIPAEPTAVES
jgi:hypothetical protein